MRPLSAPVSGLIIAAVLAALWYGGRQNREPWLRDPIVQAAPQQAQSRNPTDSLPNGFVLDAAPSLPSQQQDPWARFRPLTDAERRESLQREAAEKAERERQEREYRRQERAFYECVLRNAPRLGRDSYLLQTMCRDFPDLGSGWFGR